MQERNVKGFYAACVTRLLPQGLASLGSCTQTGTRLYESHLVLFPGANRFMDLHPQVCPYILPRT